MNAAATSAPKLAPNDSILPLPCGPAVASFQAGLATATQSLPTFESGRQIPLGQLNLGGVRPQAGGKKIAASADAPAGCPSVLDALAAALTQLAYGATPSQDTVARCDDPGQVTAIEGTITDSVAALTGSSRRLSFDLASIGAGLGDASGEPLPVSAVADSDAGFFAPETTAGHSGSAKTASPAEPAPQPEQMLASVSDQKPMSLSMSGHEPRSSAIAFAGKQRAGRVEGVPEGGGKGLGLTKETVAEAGKTSVTAVGVKGTPAISSVAAADPSSQVSPAAVHITAVHTSDDSEAAPSGEDPVYTPTQTPPPGEQPPSMSVPASTSSEYSFRGRRENSAARPEEDAEHIPDVFPDAEPAVAIAQTAGAAPGQAVAHGQQPSQAVPSPTLPTHAGTSPAEAMAAMPKAVLHPVQVLQRMGKAEIRLGLQSENFGAIRLHTSVADDRVGASVTTSHAELRDALVAEAPSLDKAITGHKLHLDSVLVDAGGAGSSFNSSNNEEQAQAPQRGWSPRWKAIGDDRVPFPGSTPQESARSGYRLDVRV